MSKQKQDIIVLTGDLVRSTELSKDNLNKALDTLAQCAATLEGALGLSLHFTVHRGDGWQAAVTRPEYALRVMLSFRAALRSLGERGSDLKFDTRIAAAKGAAQMPLNPDLNQESQSVFIASGRCLESMGKTSVAPRLKIDAQPELSACFALADYISRQWTAAQAQAIYQSLISVQPQTDTAIGIAIGKSRQTVARALHGAGQGHLIAALNSLENGEANG